MIIDFIKLYTDQILMLCSIAFVLALIPQVIFNYNNKICEITHKSSVPTAFFMAVISVVYGANGFMLAFITGGVTAALWMVIALQRYNYRRPQ